LTQQQTYATGSAVPTEAAGLVDVNMSMTQGAILLALGITVTPRLTQATNASPMPDTQSIALLNPDT
jgi:hypothetical protein